MNFLAGDIGGTKTLLGIFSWQGGLKKLYQKAYISREWKSLEPMISNFLENLPSDVKQPKKGCLAIAGLVLNGKCKLTNLNWLIEEDKLCKAAKLDSLELINDICVLIYGIPYFNKDQYIEIQNEINTSKVNRRVAIIAAGTGL